MPVRPCADLLFKLVFADKNIIDRISAKIINVWNTTHKSTKRLILD